MNRSKWQKVLDNQLKTLYNNRCKVKPMKTAEQILVDLTESVNKERSATVDENIHAVGEAIKRARDKGFGALRTPILAGGAIRDYVYGLDPKDYDIFIDVSSIPEDEQEDAVLLFGLRVIDELVNVEGSKFLALTDNTLRRLGADNPYEREDANVDPRWKNFYVFETGPFDERIQRIWNEDVAIDADRANDQFRFIKLQFIGHNDARLSKEDPTEFVEYFDYELVRCLFDPEIMAYRLHDDFVNVANSRELTVKDDRTYQRVMGWAVRFTYAGGWREPLNCPIKVKDDRPKKPTIGLLNSLSTASTVTGLYRQYVQAARNQQAANMLNQLAANNQIQARQWDNGLFRQALANAPLQAPAEPLARLEPEEDAIVAPAINDWQDVIDNF